MTGKANSISVRSSTMAVNANIGGTGHTHKRESSIVEDRVLKSHETGTGIEIIAHKTILTLMAIERFLTSSFSFKKTSFRRHSHLLTLKE